MKNSVRLCGVAMVTLVLPACATVTRGTKESFNIVSEPPAADVALSTGEKCQTPCKLRLKRKDGFTVTVRKAGYETIETKVDSEVSVGGGVAVAGNVLIGGIIGGVIDGSNGAMKDLKPNPLRVTLKPVVTAQVPATLQYAPVATEIAAAVTAPAGND
jgi:hypothetical protein